MTHSAHSMSCTITYPDGREPTTSTRTELGSARKAKRKWVQILKAAEYRWWPDGDAVIYETTTGKLIRREWTNL